jgi:predicted Zn finger-like uncharacterized protein
MKIVCESCGAKYSIADDKVAGKVFKIRCKKCSAVIVVKGDQPDADESTRVFDYGADAIWHVVVGGDQQGPLTPRQIGEMLADGRIDWEAYVWREGMDGWNPAKDVDALVSAVMAESEGGQAASTGRASSGGGGGGQVFGGSSDMGADPFASNDDGGLSGVMAQSGGAGGGADLFAQSSKSPFSGGGGDDEVRMGGNGSSPRIAENQAMTGQRNENSVLFSLSNLQALATGSGSAPASTRPSKAGMAQGEGSGLIDIRALASATASVSERPNGHSKDRVEDLLAVGSVNSTFSASTLAAPVASEKPDRSKFLLLAMAAAILCLGGAVTYLAVREPSATATAAIAPTPPVAGQAALAAPTAPAPTPAAAEAPSEPATGAAGDKGSSDEGSRAKARDENSRGDRKADKGHKAGGGGGAEAAPKAAEKSEPAAPVAKPSSSGDKSIDDLLNSALGGAGGGAKPAKAATPAKPAGADLPQTPSRDDVISAMKGVSGAVSACAAGQTGVAMCKISVAGATGKVTNVDVSGPMAGTPAASCITRAVSKAKFDKFSQSSFSVAYPFKL